MVDKAKSIASPMIKADTLREIENILRDPSNITVLKKIGFRRLRVDDAMEIFQVPKSGLAHQLLSHGDFDNLLLFVHRDGCQDDETKLEDAPSQVTSDVVDAFSYHWKFMGRKQ